MKIHLKDKDQHLVRPIEDLAFVVLEDPQITLTQQLLGYLADRNVALICCGANHLPNGMLLSLDAHSLQTARFHDQVQASLPLKKQLWQKTIKHKIRQQAVLLDLTTDTTTAAVLATMAKKVNSGDTTNLEAQAAAQYWPALLGPDFYRSPTGPSPNHALNYGYAILRAAMARALAGHGLLNTLGIHHHNQYNAFCLADDLMEPYRPFVDAMVYHMTQEGVLDNTLTKDTKAVLLQVLTMDCVWDDQSTTVGLAMQRTASSLAACFEQKSPHASLLCHPCQLHLAGKAATAHRLKVFALPPMSAPPSRHHLSAYRIMFVLVFFDLPTQTAQDKRNYTLFRTRLLYAGFQHFQHSVYVRDCPSHESAEKHTATIKRLAPDKGHVSILRVTDKQMSSMVNVYGSYHDRPKPQPVQQLTLL